MTPLTCIILANSQFPASSHPGPTQVRFAQRTADLIAEAARRSSPAPDRLEHHVDPTARRALDVLQGVLESPSGGATLVYLAGVCATGPDRHLYLIMTDTDRSRLATTALPLDALLELIDRSARSLVVLAIDCVVTTEIDAVQNAFRRLFERTRPEVHVVVAPGEPALADAESTPLSRFLARAVHEGALSPERAPESAVAVVEALWRLQQVSTPLWRWPEQPRPSPAGRGGSVFAPGDAVRGAQPAAATSAAESGGPGRPLIEIGGTGAIWYATNRRPIDPAKPEHGYSADRDLQVHYGRCKVYVPETHLIGSTGSHWWTRLRRLTDDRLKLVAIEPLVSAAYWETLHGVVDDLSADARDVLVFLHGFNVSFEEAALRAAQIGCDLQFPGVTAFFSWPSKGSPDPLAYAADGASMEGSEGDIADFLCSCAEETGANRVHVIAHSMGNRGLLRALTDIVARASRSSGARFGHFVLAAPDVDRDNFVRRAAAYHQLAERTTLYVSEKDRALRTSGIIHDAPRAGFTPPVTVVANIDTVHVANVDLTLLGHGYVAAAREVLRDMYELIVLSAPPWRRAFLKTRSAPDGSYWLIGA